jgi:hypothetical protein
MRAHNSCSRFRHKQASMAIQKGRWVPLSGEGKGGKGKRERGEIGKGALKKGTEKRMFAGGLEGLAKGTRPQR